MLIKRYFVWGFDSQNNVEVYPFESLEVANDMDSILSDLGLNKSRVSMRLQEVAPWDTDMEYHYIKDYDDERECC